ncbi:transposon ty3-g gag-pol polyprotein isoform x2 [Lasius niger]|uniref:Transposon ty3-g gag-pol polyprotein isoform x2 n=1 Tax=Lasius niger TaxID=67767 RepID=A0A0J7NB94_LASNI|nr:transposon ty3-g gag-pol polyprotein isoform x2 [Lasius niger]
MATSRANGQCERYNKTIVQGLATTMAGRDPRDWDSVIKQVQSALNTTHNKGINTTPVKALIGCETRSAAEARLLSQIQDVVHQLDLDELRHDIEAHISQEQRAQKERYDRTRRDTTKYDEDALVLVQITSDSATGSSRKLHPKFKGPFRVR